MKLKLVMRRRKSEKKKKKKNNKKKYKKKIIRFHVQLKIPDISSGVFVSFEIVINGVSNAGFLTTERPAPAAISLPGAISL